MVFGLGGLSCAVVGGIGKIVVDMLGAVVGMLGAVVGMIGAAVVGLSALTAQPYLDSTTNWYMQPDCRTSLIMNTTDGLQETEISAAKVGVPISQMLLLTLGSTIVLNISTMPSPVPWPTFDGFNG